MNDQIISKRSIVQTGLILIFAVGLFGTFGIISVLKVVDDLEAGKSFTKTLFIVPIIFLPFSIYSVYYLLSCFPKFKIDQTGITLSTIFKTKSYQWNDIDEIEITGKQFHKFLFVSMPIEATTIKFKDDSTLFLWADYYRNISDLRVVLDRADRLLKDKAKTLNSLDFVITRQLYSDHEVSSSGEDEFNGNHLLTFNGLLFYSFLIFIGFMVSKKPMVFMTNYGALFSISFATLVFCGILSYQMHYFILTDKFLIIKNSLWFWRKDIYSLDNIREVVIESPHRLSTSMRVITKDFKTKLYPAGNLTDKKWKLLRDQIQSKEITLRNEAFI